MANEELRLKAEKKAAQIMDKAGEKASWVFSEAMIEIDGYDRCREKSNQLLLKAEAKANEVLTAAGITNLYDWTAEGGRREKDAGK